MKDIKEEGQLAGVDQTGERRIGKKGILTRHGGLVEQQEVRQLGRCIA
jgi:hypothetical protein